MSVVHICEPCKNGWTDQDVILGADSGGPKVPCVRWGSRSFMGMGNFGGCLATESIGSQCCDALDSKKSITVTAAASWNAPDWMVSHTLFFFEKSAPAIMCYFIKILWSLVEHSTSKNLRCWLLAHTSRAETTENVWMLLLSFYWTRRGI